MTPFLFLPFFIPLLSFTFFFLFYSIPASPGSRVRVNSPELVSNSRRKLKKTLTTESGGSSRKWGAKNQRQLAWPKNLTNSTYANFSSSPGEGDDNGVERKKFTVFENENYNDATRTVLVINKKKERKRKPISRFQFEGGNNWWKEKRKMNRNY